MTVNLNVLSWAATAPACVAAVVQSFAPMWLFVGLILLSMVLTLVGLLYFQFVAQRVYRRLELEAKMEAAFGDRSTA